METASNIGWFDLPADTSLARLLRTLSGAGYLAGPPAHTRYECLFVETQDGRLAKGGSRLALRRTGRQATWQFSGPDGESAAPVQGEPAFRSLSPDGPGLPPAATELAGGRLLFPLVRLRVSAHDVRLQSPAGDALALHAERFSAAPPSGDWSTKTPPQGRLSVRFLEGDPDALLHLTTYLRDRLTLPVTVGDACAAALQALGLPEPGAPVPLPLRIHPEDPLTLAARKVVGQQVLKMQANIAGALEDLDPEYLHDLRVATRRLRSALRLFANVLGPKRCDFLRGELNWIGQRLGAVRDLDVFILNLQAQAQRVGEGAVVAGLLVEELGRQRAPAIKSLETALVSRRFLSLMRRLETLASSPPPRRPRGAQGVPVSEGAPALIWTAQKRVLMLGRTIGPDAPATALHQLRILFKRLRYATEFFREAFVDPATGEDPFVDYVAAMVRFQDCLGEHQDAVVAMVRIQDLAKEIVLRGELAPERLLDLGGLIQVQREIARERRGRLAKLWARFDRPAVRKRLRALRTKAPRASEAGEGSAPAPA